MRVGARIDYASLERSDGTSIKVSSELGVAPDMVYEAGPRSHIYPFMAPVLEAGLPTSGICRAFPRDLVYGPLKYQGLALPNLHTVQGIENILTVMEFGYNMKTLTGQLLKGNVEALQLELGVGTPVFVKEFWRYGTLVTSSWNQHTW
jgi:hypothetical protein